MKAGRLFVVSTPIGNMGDFSFRAVEVLGAVQVVLAEDTRHSRALLDRYRVGTPMLAYHEHNEARATPGVVRRLLAGEDVALIADAGTPLLSDPGARLVRAAIDAGVEIVPIPGASALLAALVVSGLDTGRFAFHGFPPRRGQARVSWLDEVASSALTAVMYEAPSRVAETLRELGERDGSRQAVVCRELTKRFEEVRRGTVTALAAYYKEVPPRGEVVLVLAGRTEAALDETALTAEAAGLRRAGMSVRDAVAELAKRGVPRNAAYRAARAFDKERDGGMGSSDEG